MTWLAAFLILYAVGAVAVAVTVAEVDAEFGWTENQTHMAASIVCAAFWPLFVVYLASYRSHKRAASRRLPHDPRRGK